jgi:hypothetical protein
MLLERIRERPDEDQFQVRWPVAALQEHLAAHRGVCRLCRGNLVEANRAAERSSPAWIWVTAPIDVVPVIPLVENKALFVEGEECDACHRQGPALLGP